MLFTALTVNLDILVNFAHTCEAKFLMNVQIKYQEI